MTLGQIGTDRRASGFGSMTTMRCPACRSHAAALSIGERGDDDQPGVPSQGIGHHVNHGVRLPSAAMTAGDRVVKPDPEPVQPGLQQCRHDSEDADQNRGQGVTRATSSATGIRRGRGGAPSRWSSVAPLIRPPVHSKGAIRAAAGRHGTRRRAEPQDGADDGQDQIIPIGPPTDCRRPNPDRQATVQAKQIAAQAITMLASDPGAPNQPQCGRVAGAGWGTPQARRKVANHASYSPRAA